MNDSIDLLLELDFRWSLGGGARARFLRLTLSASGPVYYSRTADCKI